MKLQTLKPSLPMLDTLRAAPALPSECNDRRRVYESRRWRERVRPAKLRRDPLCQRCLFLGLTHKAEHIDHWTPIAQGGDPWSDDNLVSLCASDHSIKTACEQKGEAFPEVARSNPSMLVVA